MPWLRRHGSGVYWFCCLCHRISGTFGQRLHLWEQQAAKRSFQAYGRSPWCRVALYSAGWALHLCSVSGLPLMIPHHNTDRAMCDWQQQCCFAGWCSHAVCGGRPTLVRLVSACRSHSIMQLRKGTAVGSSVVVGCLWVQDVTACQAWGVGDVLALPRMRILLLDALGLVCMLTAVLWVAGVHGYLQASPGKSSEGRSHQCEPLGALQMEPASRDTVRHNTPKAAVTHLNTLARGGQQGTDKHAVLPRG